MVTAKLYIEGGGEGQTHDIRFRKAWNTFFKAAGFEDHMPRIVRCGGRDNAFRAFETAVRSPDAKYLPLLLVDSEAPVAPESSVWEQLKTRDNWTKPANAAADQAFLMVQVMETWFLADRAMLRDYFGDKLKESCFKKWPSLEDLPKQEVFKILENATAKCKKPYAKGQVSFELIEKLNPARVERACPHAAALFDRLREI